jgi:hypothetical protein
VGFCEGSGFKCGRSSSGSTSGFAINRDSSHSSFPSSSPSEIREGECLDRFLCRFKVVPPPWGAESFCRFVRTPSSPEPRDR